MMTNEDTKHILLRKYNDDSLASLYLLHYDSQKINPHEWIRQFHLSLTPAEDHPDVLKIEKDEKNNDYKVDSQGIKNMLQFINFKPYQLKKRFIFLFDAQDLTVIVSNKLLKIFEELAPFYCFILLAPDNAVLLPTVMSRAIKLRLTDAQSELNKVELNFEAINTPQEFLAYLKQTKENSDYIEKKFIEFKINQLLKTCAQNQASEKSYLNCAHYLETLQNFEKSAAFNNSKLSRMSALFT